MRMLIDAEGVKRMAYLRTETFEHERHYFAARDCLAMVVVRVQHRNIIGNDALDVLMGKVVDAAIGWDRGEAGFVFKRNVGKRHSKATLYKILDGAAYDVTLSQFLDGAPRIKGVRQ